MAFIAKIFAGVCKYQEFIMMRAYSISADASSKTNVRSCCRIMIQWFKQHFKNRKGKNIHVQFVNKCPQITRILCEQSVRELADDIYEDV